MKAKTAFRPMAIYVRWRLRRSPRIRRGDESPDCDLALPCPRRSLASPGVASATSPTLRVSSSRRSRMSPSRHTNGHESLQLALRHLATFPMSSSLQWLRASPFTIPLILAAPPPDEMRLRCGRNPIKARRGGEKPVLDRGGPRAAAHHAAQARRGDLSLRALLQVV